MLHKIKRPFSFSFPYSPPSPIIAKAPKVSLTLKSVALLQETKFDIFFHKN